MLPVLWLLRVATGFASGFAIIVVLEYLLHVPHHVIVTLARRVSEWCMLAGLAVWVACALARRWLASGRYNNTNSTKHPQT